MTWRQAALTALLASGLLAAWYRYSIEKNRLRRLAELYLWLGPILPLGVLSQVHHAAGLHAFVPAAVVHLGLIGLALFGVTARLAGGLLIVGSTVVWLGAATFPGMQLEQVASHRMSHWITSGGFLLGALITLAGFTLLTVLLHDAGERVLSHLGWAAFLVAVVSWLFHLAFRATVMLSAAEELASSGAAPPWYPALREWSGSMYAIYMTLAYLATAAYGGAMRKTGWAGRGWGRAFVIFGLVAAAGFVARTGAFNPPLLVQFMPYAMGMILIRRTAATADV
ncbi:MAG: hypothetical protein ACRD96_17735 [Bryobacteraceae bacterium]